MNLSRRSLLIWTGAVAAVAPLGPLLGATATDVNAIKGTLAAGTTITLPYNYSLAYFIKNDGNGDLTVHGWRDDTMKPGEMRKFSWGDA